MAHPEPLPDVPLEQLAPLQRHVLETLWDGGPGTVYDLRDRLADGESVPYTSVLSALQKLEKFGWVTHESRTQNRVRQYVYAAAGDRGTARRGTLQRLLHGVFDGDAFQMAQQLLAGESLSAEELAVLRKLIDQRRREAGGPPHVRPT